MREHDKRPDPWGVYILLTIMGIDMIAFDPSVANPLYNPILFHATVVLGLWTFIIAWYTGGGGGKSA